ncbi:protein SHORT-ROOT-like [Zingiber officinale]|uniref:protein SHORT-ROOT-like n=1 Tax=Zingiber officinale TaxID=94328 RepID=UPI001C4BDCA4|nr:protein SHORT-ROOT-like [Zingiber officinale]
MLNEFASPYGDCEQHLPYAFLQALFCRATASDDHYYSTSLAVAERTVSFASTRRLALKFQEAAPWSTFGHVAANGALLQALDGDGPRSLEALASRAGADAPRVRLTVVSSTAAGVVAEIGARIEKFARLMGVPLEFRAIAAPTLPRLIDALRPKKLELREGEVVAVNCVGALQRAGCEDSRDSFLRAAAVLRPRVLTVVEDEADFGAASEFMESFEECLWFYGSYFEMLEKASRRCATSGLLWRGSASGASSDCWRGRCCRRRGRRRTCT